MFSQTVKDFQYETGDLVNIAFRVERNEFRGEVKPAVQIVDIAFADSDFDIYNASRRVYEKFRGGAELSEKEVKLLTPDRAFFASVYKFLKAKNGFSYGAEAFCHRARCPYKYAAKVLVTIDVMEELGLIGREAEKITLLPTSGKVELTSSAILKKLTQKEMSV